jgi:hypothetical protein
LRKKLDDMLAAMGEHVKQEVHARLCSFGFLLRQYYSKENLTDLFRWARQAFNLGSRPELNDVVETAVNLRRVQALIYLHYTLKAWLPFHVGFTALMLAFMVYHIIQVLHFG